MISSHSQLLRPMRLLQINVYRVQGVAQWTMSKDLKERLIKMAMRGFGAIFPSYLTNYTKLEGKIMLSLLKEDKSFRSESFKKQIELPCCGFLNSRLQCFSLQM